MSEPGTPRDPHAGGVFALFLVSSGASVALGAVYWQGGQPQWEGALLAVSLGCFGAALVLWANRFLESAPHVQRRHELEGEPEERAEVEHDLERVVPLTRRRVLLGGCATAAVTLVGALVFPVRSLGPSPGRSLLQTPWRKGRRAVTSDNQPVRAADVPSDGIVTVFPEGAPDSADGQAILVRVDPELIVDEADRRASPGGLLCFSKVCTHAGCPVGLYQSERHELLCPCHQSTFDVLRGGKPTFGPAARALPRLPIEVDAHGYVTALGDFPEPVGPSWWFRP